MSTNNGYGAFYKMPKELSKQLFKKKLPASAWKVLEYIRYQILGWNGKTEDAIANSQFQKALELSKRIVIMALQILEKEDIIKIKRTGKKGEKSETNIISLVVHLGVQEITPVGVQEITPTIDNNNKETITKENQDLPSSLPTRRSKASSIPKSDPLEKLKILSDYYPDLLVGIKENHSRAKLPTAGSPEENKWRAALRHLVKIDKYSEQEIVDCFKWLFEADQEDADFWRKQVQALPPLPKKKTGDSLTKFDKIHEKFVAAETDGKGRGKGQPYYEEECRYPDDDIMAIAYPDTWGKKCKKKSEK